MMIPQTETALENTCLSIFCLCIFTGAFLFLSPKAALSAENEAKLAIMTPSVQRERLMVDMLKAFEQKNPDIQARLWHPFRPLRTWVKATDAVARGRMKGEAVLLLTSREE